MFFLTYIYAKNVDFLGHKLYYICVLLIYIVNLIKTQVTWEDRISVEELLLSGCPMGMSRGNCVDKRLIWEGPAFCVHHHGM